MMNNADITTLQEQLIELQTQLAFQEDTLQALNTVLARQQRSIDLLEQENRQLRGLMENLLSQQAEGEEPPPPHY